MIDGKRVLAVITARGGSKGLPRKNILPLCGKPLLAWSIEQGRASRIIDRLIVSTDDQEIADIAKKHGGEVPFLHPPALAADETPTHEVIIHALDQCEKKGEKYDLVILLEPTSPLRETQDIDQAFEKLSRHPTAKAIVSVAKAEGIHPEFLVQFDPKTGCLRKMDGSADFQAKRRQDVSELFFFEGTLYISDVPTYRAKKSFYHADTLPYVVPRWKSLEIDDKWDMICAEALLKARQTGEI